MSEFNKKVGKDIPKEEADRLIKRWKDTKPKTNSSFFGSDHLQRLINTPNSVGIRIHYGLNEKGEMQPVLTAQIEEDSSVAAKTTNEGPYVDSSLGCPPYC